MFLITFFQELFEKEALNTKEERSMAIKALGHHSNPNGLEQLTRVRNASEKRLQYLKQKKA